MLSFLHGRTIFFTDTGHIGRSTGNVKDGDMLAGLFGINLPFILRPRDAGKYAMVNVAHVADHILCPPWEQEEWRFWIWKTKTIRREEKFTII
jgi:hypothetical protein